MTNDPVLTLPALQPWSLPRGARRRPLWLNPHETGDPFAHDWMIVDGENPNRRAAGHDASPSTSAGALAANRRDHHERLADVA